MIDEDLDDVGAALVRGAVQRRAAGVGLRVRVEAELDQHLHRFERRLRRPLVGDAFDPADAGGDVQRRHAEHRVDLRIGAACASSSFISSTSPDCEARRNAVAPFSSSHWFVKTVRVSVLSLTRG